MKTMNKLGLGILVLLLTALVPLTSASKDNKPEILALNSQNLLILSGEVNGESVGKLITEAKEISAKSSFTHRCHIYLYLNTPGGQVEPGLELVEALKGLDCKVDTVTSFAASMGFQIAENLGTRYILDKGKLMSHRASGSFEGSFGGTSPSQLDQRYHLWLTITREMDQTVVDRTNGKQTLKSYQEAYNNELWVTGHEAVAQGYADSIVHVRCDASLAGTTRHSLEFMGMQISYELDKCPINTSPLNVHVGGAMNGISSEYAKNVKEQFLSSYQMKQETPVVMKQDEYGVSY